MKLVRFLENGLPRFAVLEGSRVRELMRPYFEGVVALDRTVALEEVELLPPTRPSKIICVGLNYRDHAEETGMEVPAEPVLFLKPPTTALGAGRPICRPPDVGRVDYEAELAIVVKDSCRDVPVDEADAHILGYTCFNDVTARDLQKKDGQWTRAKGFDTFAPFGPWIETDLGDPGDLKIELLLNGEAKQSSSTSLLIFPCRELLSFVSRVMTLKPGDVIATGTPAGIGPIRVGDTVEVKIEGIGSLINPVGGPHEEKEEQS